MGFLDLLGILEPMVIPMQPVTTLVQPVEP